MSATGTPTTSKTTCACSTEPAHWQTAPAASLVRSTVPFPNCLESLRLGQIILQERQDWKACIWINWWFCENSLNFVIKLPQSCKYYGFFRVSVNCAPLKLNPECEYTGQTLPYPDSCRKYYECLADGTWATFDCCPDVFDPTSDSCVLEEVGGGLCGADDEGCN